MIVVVHLEARGLQNANVSKHLLTTVHLDDVTWDKVLSKHQLQGSVA